MLLKVRILVLVALSVPLFAFAGSCLEEPEFYLQAIEKQGGVKQEGGEDPLDCLTLVVDYWELARDEAPTTEKLESLKATRNQSQALAWKVLPKLLESKDTKMVCAAAGALALYQYNKAYEPLAACPGDTQKALMLAILGDTRATDWIIAKYRETQKKFRKRPRAAQPYLLTYLNALFFLADSKSKPFLEEVSKSPLPAVQQRAKLVLKRLAS